MSRIIYYTNAQGVPKWSAPSIIFREEMGGMGPLSVRQGQNFAASNSSALLGPDLNMPGGGGNNPPTATGYVWSLPVTFAGGPAVTFDLDGNYQWKRGHLVNGRWGGSGADWRNLTPLTNIANPNHSTIEAYMDRYLESSLNYETSGYRTHWYCLWYAVQCSAAPFSAAPAPGDLYSYAPEFIRVNWRAVSVIKPVNYSVAQVQANPLMAGGPVTVPVLPFTAPVVPQVPGWPVAVLPPGNVPGGAVLGALPVGYPAAQANGFDGQIEIHQT